MRALTDRQRTAVALRYVLDLPEADVARIMGIARGTASATLATARRRLAAALAPPPATPPPAVPPAPVPPPTLVGPPPTTTWAFEEV